MITKTALSLGDVFSQLPLREFVFTVLVAAAIAGIILDLHTKAILGAGLLLFVSMLVNAFGPSPELAFLLILLAAIIRSSMEYADVNPDIDDTTLANLIVFLDDFFTDDTATGPVQDHPPGREDE